MSRIVTEFIRSPGGRGVRESGLVRGLRLTAVLVLLVSAGGGAQDVAPLPEGSNIVASHAPFEIGECGLCHQNGGLNGAGPISGEVNELCFGCHEGMRSAMERARITHSAATGSCTTCHNPHNARFPKLLLDAPPQLCASCHEDVWQLATSAPVRHGSMVTERSCLNCHNPHASNVDSLLSALPFDLCVNCHTRDGLRDNEGVELTNFGELLAENPVAHGPVAAKDCSACHRPHGGENFRLLKNAYPADFYAPFNPENYRLCFECHNEEMVAAAETTTLTGFRDGARNLHYLHVNKQDRGRTCRACHEVHAAPQAHLIRDGVPYGSKGWVLKINYRPTEHGGTCEKTCHAAKSYDRTAGETVGSAAP